MSEIRAFLAIDIPVDIKNKISEIEDDFKRINANVKYVETKNLHLTLKFFGDIDEEGIENLSDKIKAVVSDYKPFKLAIKGCGAFPNENYIKVIWIGVGDNPILTSLHDDLDNEFASLGIDKDKNFSTHLTIGRMKSVKGKEDVKDKIAKYSNFDVGNITIDEIKLKKRTLTPKGPIYEDLKVFKIE